MATTTPAIPVPASEADYPPEHPRRLIPELCRLFYGEGWCTGTGGGISLKQGCVE
jgi:methylthioribulose-1-phosphate dehydratase